ncbi:MAG: ABC transporter permease [Muribaculaceae bacterium]|nr:ABC transporter permease [Muribaculaceae bacterium]
MSKIGIVIAREYKERVSKKSFIITTLLVPLLFIGLSILPALLMAIHESDTTTYAVIDRSGIVMPQLEDTSSLHFVAVEDSLQSAKQNSDYDGVLVIGADIVSNPSEVTLLNHSAANMDGEMAIRSQIKKAVETERLKAYNLENLKEIIKEVEADVTITTYRIDEKDGTDSSALPSEISFAIGLGVAFILYMFLIIYGQMVMTSIIEEKNNRVLEIVVSSVKPEQLMMGKICGIGLVAITQVAIWVLLIAAGIFLLLPALMPADVMTEVAAYNSGQFDAATAINDPYMVSTMAQLTQVGFLLKIFGYLTLFLIGGFFLYSSIFAAIGSAVDNIQDASQLQTVAMLPFILAIAFATMVGSDPGSSMSMWLSMIPFISPIVMMVRVPFDIPAWQIWTSLALLYATFFFMVWFAAKIYRVGIFMYGKKPTIKELIKWARYK